MAAGVSNFDLEDLAELLKIAHVRPAVVQRNSDPFHADRHVQAFCFKAGIQYQVGKALSERLYFLISPAGDFKALPLSPQWHMPHFVTMETHHFIP